MLRPNTVLAARYIIVRQIESGGMGTVYQATDQRIPGKLWAVKEMSDAAITNPLDKQQAVDAFQREAQLLATLDHGNLSNVSDYFTERGKHYLVMDFVQGQTLEQVLHSAPAFLPEDEVVGWALQLCDVLAYLHSRQPPIIFRDLKPANIMVDAEGRIKLIDFGIARFFEPGKQTDTLRMGTMGYAPPEQYEGQGQTDARSDIYSLGATLHHLLTGRDPAQHPPFSFDTAPPRSLNPAVSSHVEAIIVQALTYDRAHRFQSATEMKQALLGGPLPGPALKPISTPLVKPRPAGDAERLKPEGAMFRANLQRTGVYEARGVHQLTEMEWKYRTGGAVRSSPVVANGVVYFGSHDGHLHAVKGTKGTHQVRTGGWTFEPERWIARKWRFRAEAEVASSPAVADGVVYFGSHDGHLYAVDAKSGRAMWTKQGQWGFKTEGAVHSSPAVAEGMVYFGSNDRHLYAVNTQTGQEQWRFRTKGVVYSSPAVADGVVYFGSHDQHLYAVDTQTGQVKWKFKTQHTVSSSPAIAGQEVYFGSYDGHLYAVDTRTGQEAWRFKTWGLVYSSPAVTDGVVYFGSYDGHLYAVDTQTGQVKWKLEAGGLVYSSPALADGVVYFGSHDSHLYAVDTQTGQAKWKFKTGGAVYSSPAVADGVVYFGSNDGHLYALR